MATDNVFPFERRVPPAPPHDLDVPAALARCRAMVATLGRYDLPDEVGEACVIMLLVNLHDLLQRARSLGSPVVFADQVEQNDEIGNITELVAKCRNAACHVWGRASAGGARAFRYNRIAGYCPRAYVIDGKPLGCDYHDDVAIYHGHTRLYLKRHAGRAVDELGRLFLGT
jgi:hypothetical protein